MISHEQPEPHLQGLVLFGHGVCVHEQALHGLENPMPFVEKGAKNWTSTQNSMSEFQSSLAQAPNSGNPLSHTGPGKARRPRKAMSKSEVLDHDPAGVAFLPSTVGRSKRAHYICYTTL